VARVIISLLPMPYFAVERKNMFHYNLILLKIFKLNPNLISFNHSIGPGVKHK
jgi:hypothetical protein